MAIYYFYTFRQKYILLSNNIIPLKLLFQIPNNSVESLTSSNPRMDMHLYLLIQIGNLAEIRSYFRFHKLTLRNSLLSPFDEFLSIIPEVHLRAESGIKYAMRIFSCQNARFNSISIGSFDSFNFSILQIELICQLLTDKF